MRPRFRPPDTDDEPSPLTKARGAARRIWFEFDRTLGRKYYLVATLRDDRRVTPEDEHRIKAVLAEIDAHLADLDAQLDVAEAAVEKLDVNP